MCLPLFPLLNSGVELEVSMLRLELEEAGSSDVLWCTRGEHGLVTGQVAEVEGDCVEERNDEEMITSSIQ